LPDHWAVVSINVTEDRNTMFVSRHQKGRNPIVFTLPLDRQGKREGEEDDMFTFETAVEQMTAIINESNDNARSAKTVDSQAGRMAWWAKRHELDKRLQELLANLEYCWLGAFKVGPNEQTWSQG
jgi:separase